MTFSQTAATFVQTSETAVKEYCNSTLGMQSTTAAENKPSHEDWCEEALCAEIGGDVFFPTGKGAARAYADCRRICESCTVREPCLAHGLNGEEPGRRHGMFGGLDPQERELISMTPTTTPTITREADHS